MVRGSNRGMPQIAAHVVADHHVSEMSERARGSSAPALSLRTARDRGPVPCVVAWPGASPMVADAVTGLAIGEMSQPVECDEGYQVLQRVS